MIYQSFTCIENCQIDVTNCLHRFHPPNIKLYIFNLIPSQHVSPKPVVVLITIDHQMVVLHV